MAGDDRGEKPGDEQRFAALEKRLLERMEALVGGLASKEDLRGLASKVDIRDLASRADLRRLERTLTDRFDERTGRLSERVNGMETRQGFNDNVLPQVARLAPRRLRQAEAESVLGSGSPLGFD